MRSKTWQTINIILKSEVPMLHWYQAPDWFGPLTHQTVSGCTWARRFHIQSCVRFRPAPWPLSRAGHPCWWCGQSPCAPSRPGCYSCTWHHRLHRTQWFRMRRSRSCHELQGNNPTSCCRHRPHRHHFRGVLNSRSKRQELSS